MSIMPPAVTVTAEPIGPDREAAFSEVLRVLADRRDEFAKQSHVPRDFVDLMKRAGIYRASTPAQFGGEPQPPADFMRRIEDISAVDPSTGWVASFGSALGYFGALPVETQRRIYSSGPDIVFAGGWFPLQEAERVDGGFVCSGTWQFASGCMAADILGIGLKGEEEAGGRPLAALVDPADAEIVENWDVSGMQSTGSHAVRVDCLFVPEEHTFVRGGPSAIDEPLNRYPATALAAQVLAVVALGAARGALQLLEDSVTGSKSVTGGGSRGERPSFRAGLARGHAAFSSVRSWFYEVTERVWGQALREEEISEISKAELRLAAAHAAHEARRVILEAFDLSGTGAIYRSHPMQRYLQDGLVPAQHAMLASNSYEAAGAVLLGYDSGAPSFP